MQNFATKGFMVLADSGLLKVFGMELVMLLAVKS
jgi:hypothetical protein